MSLHIVGEQGPEIFVPKRPGLIISLGPPPGFLGSLPFGLGGVISAHLTLHAALTGQMRGKVLTTPEFRRAIRKRSTR